MYDERLDEATLAGIAFLGNTLGPLFLYDPKFNASYVQPVLKAVAELDTGAAADEWPFTEAYSTCSYLNMMQRGLAAGTDDPELSAEYCRLFVGPDTKAAPPWGSVYTEREKVIFGGSTIQLRRWMRKEGIALDRGGSEEPEDHIGSMLFMMAWIAENRPEVLIEYLQDYLLTWAPHFMSVVIKATEHQFYQGLARLALASLNGLQQCLDIYVQEPKFYR